MEPGSRSNPSSSAGPRTRSRATSHCAMARSGSRRCLGPSTAAATAPSATAIRSSAYATPYSRAVTGDGAVTVCSPRLHVRRAEPPHIQAPNEATRVPAARVRPSGAHTVASLKPPREATEFVLLFDETVSSQASARGVLAAPFRRMEERSATRDARVASCTEPALGSARPRLVQAGGSERLEAESGTRPLISGASSAGPRAIPGTSRHNSGRVGHKPGRSHDS